MPNVKFKSKIKDRDTQFEYPISNEFVEVSDAFADRLKTADPNGERFEFEGVDYGSKEVEKAEIIVSDSELQAKIDEQLSQIQTLTQDKEELVAEKLTVDNKLITANELLEDQRILIEAKDLQIVELNQTIEKLSEQPKEEAKETLFDKPKDKK